MPDNFKSTQPFDDLFTYAPPKPLEKRKVLLRIVCPACAQLITVNALDKSGSTPSPCRYCGAVIWIETDEEGYIVGIHADAVEREVKKKFKWDARAVLALAVVMLVLVLFLWALMRTVGRTAGGPSAAGVSGNLADGPRDADGGVPANNAPASNGQERQTAPPQR